VIATLIYSGVATVVILKIVGSVTGGLRVTEEEEEIGLDLSCHDERGYII